MERDQGPGRRLRPGLGRRRLREGGDAALLPGFLPGVRNAGSPRRDLRGTGQETWRPAGLHRPFLEGRTARRAEERRPDRKSVVQGKSVSVRVDLGGRAILKKK